MVLPIIKVLNYCYDALIDNKVYDKELDVIFNSGFLLLRDLIFELAKIYEFIYNKDSSLFIKNSREIYKYILLYELLTELNNEEFNIDAKKIIKKIKSEYIDHKRIIDSNLLTSFYSYFDPYIENKHGKDYLPESAIFYELAQILELNDCEGENK